MTAKATQPFFPVVPEYMSWEDWNGNVGIYFGREPIMHDSEENWQMVASQISSLPTFSAYPIVPPDAFDTWQDWAKEFTTIINGPSR